MAVDGKGEMMYGMKQASVDWLVTKHKEVKDDEEGEKMHRWVAKRETLRRGAGWEQTSRTSRPRGANGSLAASTESLASRQ